MESEIKGSKADDGVETAVAAEEYVFSGGVYSYLSYAASNLYFYLPAAPTTFLPDMELISRMRRKLHIASEPINREDFNINALDPDCFLIVFRYLSIHDLVQCRSVCQYWLQNVDFYFIKLTSFNFDGRLNGAERRNGQYIFNATAFNTIVTKMPNLRVLHLNKSKIVNNALAVSEYNVLLDVARHCPKIEQIHVGRCRGFNRAGFVTLVDNCATLTHLTITLYNEGQLEILIKGLPQLRYLNLRHSVLGNYAPCLEHLGDRIETLVAAPDYGNHKIDFIESLVKGNGRRLEELAVSIQVFLNDHLFFQRIAAELTNVRDFKCFVDSRKMSEATTPTFAGLHKLVNLEVLHLDERLVGSLWVSAVDDQSLLPILRHCSKLKDIRLWTDSVNFLTDSSISLIPQMCPHLGSLALKNAAVTDASLFALTSLGGLRRIKLHSLNYVTNNGLIDLVTMSNRIKAVQVDQCVQISDGAVAAAKEIVRQNSVYSN